MTTVQWPVETDAVSDEMILPRGWVWTTLGNIANINPRVDVSALPDETPVSFVPMAAVEAGTGQMDSSEIRPLKEVKKGYTSFREGDVLFAKITPCMENGKSAIAQSLSSNIGFGSTEFHVLRPSPAIDAGLLYFYLSQESFRQNARAHMTGTAGQLRVPASYLADTQFPLAPLAEQRRIVAAIEQQFTRLDEGVAALRRARVALKRYRAAVLKAAVEGRLTEQWRAERLAAVGEPAVETAPEGGLWPPRNPPTRVKGEGVAFESGEMLLERILAERRRRWEADLRARGKDAAKARYEEPKGPDVGSLPELPEGWCWATFEQVSERVTVGHVGSMKDEYVAEGIPFLRGQNVRPNRFDPEGLKYVSRAFHEQLSKSRLEPGDLLVVRSGSVGIACIMPDTYPEANCSDLVIVKRPIFVNPNFAAYYMNSAAQGRVRARQVGIALTHFNTQSMAALPFPLPPLGEQEQIVAEVERRLSVVGELDATVEANLKRAERLRQSILREAFAGRLVAQDASDEPAGVPAVETAPEGFAALSRETRLRGLTEGKRAVEAVGQVGLWGDDGG